MARLKLEGYANSSDVVKAFASDLVDVAYVDEVTDDAIYVIGDVGYDYTDPETFEWASEVILLVMERWRIGNVRISLESP